MPSPAVPGTLNVTGLSGDEIVEINPRAARRSQTTTAEIAALGVTTSPLVVTAASGPISGVKITGDVNPRAALTVNSALGTGTLKFGNSSGLGGPMLYRISDNGLGLGNPDGSGGANQSINVTGATGTDVGGGNISITAGASTGTGSGGVVSLRTGARGASTGSSANSVATVATIGYHTLLSNQTQPALTLTQTWNTTGTPDAIQLALTNTASNAASRLLNLLVGAVSMLAVRVDGLLTAAAAIVANGATAIPAGGANTLGFKATSTANFGVFFGSGVPTLSAAKGSLYLRSDGSTTNDRAYINTDGGTTWTALTTVA